MKPLILIVDDEAKESDSIVQELKLSGYEVVLQQEVDSALRFLEDNRNRIHLLILDIMMPPGSELSGDDTMYGLRTGIFFYRRVRTMASSLPIIVLTNVSDHRVAENFKSEKDVRFLRKQNFLPYQLAEEVAQVLRGAAPA